ncbi:tRNA pseudouridine(38-40) synthase TruA [Cohnella faecalis]|uniref:tRNA pseudouridine synthase A n=1 Tax=Cohnella faecalis TaxID=2315694 RepID=A0A398CWS6_9BACL|nr:tRNA pseudouridine(38-40) synthase TruA [Cohnella faecalis]RIE05018.1 tRNA pseudouridine(38-40) synthase TruA [Cohnella faecalis]
MRNIAMIVSYDGTNYSGFQSQPGCLTIQGELEKALFVLTGQHIRVNGSGRTDAGVHAKGQVINFRTDCGIPVERFALAINARLPGDIVVQSVYEAPQEFHARHDPKSKTYRYSILCSRFADVFRRKYELHHPTPLDFAAMAKGLEHLIGEHDFSSFASPKSTKSSHVRTIYECRLEVETLLPFEDTDAWRYPGKQRGRIHLYVKGNGFLYNMVRIIAATVILIGEGKLSPSDMARILVAKDRSQAAPTAAPHALSLWALDYGEVFGDKPETPDEA